MRLSIDHRTIYRFSAPQGRLVQMLRMTPENNHDQTVAAWQIHVDCDAKMRPGRDGFGNAVTMLYVEGPIRGIEIEVSGEVLTSHSNGVLHGVAEVLPPALFLRATAMTPADAAIIGWAADLVGDTPKRGWPQVQPSRARPRRRAIWRRSSWSRRDRSVRPRATSRAMHWSRANTGRRRMAGPRHSSMGSAGSGSIRAPAARQRRIMSASPRRSMRPARRRSPARGSARATKS
jgi:hypothetical protein